VYDPNELAKIKGMKHGKLDASRDPGEIAARCFEAFIRGSTLCEIVIDLREHPDKIRDLHDKWLDMGGANFVISPEAKAELEKMLGPFGNVATLVDLVRAQIHQQPPL
jgi:peptidyl-tRNA hydrolase